MTDLVERLRAVPHPLCAEAAAEIERLRKAIRPFAAAAVGMKGEEERGVSCGAYGKTVPNLRNWRRLAAVAAGDRT